MSGTRLKGGLVAVLGMLLAVGVVSGPSASAAGVTRWVDPNAGSPGPGTGCGSSAGYASVQAAVDASTGEDIVEVCAGLHYQSEVTIAGTEMDGLTIRGPQAGIPTGAFYVPIRAGAEAYLDNQGSPEPTITIAADDVTIDGLALQNGADGSIGIDVVGSDRSGIDILNTFFNGGPVGNQAEVGLRSESFDDMRIVDNNLYGYGSGIDLSGQRSDGPSLIQGNAVIDSAEVGITMGPEHADGHLLVENLVAEGGYNGDVTGISVPATGIEIRDNRISGNPADGTGVRIGTNPRSGVKLLRNDIVGFRDGVVYEPPVAVLPPNAPRNEARFNNIYVNGQYSLLNSGVPGAFDLDATCNWLGAADGPEPPFTGLVSAGVDYEPWSIAEVPNFFTEYFSPELPEPPCTGTSGPVDPPSGPRVSVGDQSGLERDAVTGSVFVPVYLSEPASEPVVVSFHTVDGSAVAGVDYTRWGTPTNPRTVTIPAGQVQGQINVPVLADAQVEGDETFSLVLTSVSGGGFVIGEGTATATIVDADAVSLDAPAISVSNPTVVEGDAGQRRAQFQIHLSRVPDSPVTVSYASSDGTAIAGDDYVAKLPGTVVFAPGQISKTIDVLVNSNTTVDVARAFNLQVSVTGGSPVEELNLAGVATIVDDDSAIVSEPCAPGRFNSTDGNEPCEPAPPGTFVDTAGALAATPCAPGSFQDQVGQTSCQLAAVGSYVDAAGSTASTLCPDGSTTLTIGSTSVDDCIPEPGGGGAVAITAGGSGHSCALLEDGTARCWGNNSSGQLGDGTDISSNVPVVVSGLTDVVDIAAGTFFTCAVRADGSVLCWGENPEGQLGNGTNTGSNVPVAVSGLTDAVDISASSLHACAVLGDGTARCWGPNGSGQLGDGTGITSNVPVAVSGLSDATSVSAGASQTCAVLGDGTARCWGFNFRGQLGDGTTTESNVPVAVSGLSGVTAVGAGNNHVCAVLGDGSVRCWGDNVGGMLGIGNSGGYSPDPMAVVGIP